MIRFWCALVIVLGLWPGQSIAQSIPVRSGEHDNFTRLVLDWPVPLEWDLQQGEDRLYRLRLDGRQLPLDVSSVFSRIDRARIANVTSAPDSFGLDISLACDCEINAFALGSTMLVLDVSAADNSPESEAVPSLPRLTLGSMPRIGPAAPSARPFAVESVMTKNALINAPTQEKSNDSPDQVAELSRSIAESVANAATRGLLNAVERPTGVVANLVEPARVEPSEGFEDSQTSIAIERLGIRDVEQGRIRIGATSCVPRNSLNLSGWATDEPFPAQLARFQRSLSDAVDRVDPVELERLSRLYLHFGFGAEAAATNRLAGPNGDQIIAELAAIIDETSLQTGTFSGQEYCNSPAALWAVLSRTKLDALAINGDAVLQSFEDLPLHLRKHLGPRLSNRLTEAGATSVSASVLHRLRRAYGSDTSEMRLAKSRIDAREGEIETAQSIWTDLAHDGNDVAASAVVEISNLSIEKDRALPADIAELADAYATELRGTESGDDLWVARVKGMADAALFGDAFAEIKTSGDIETGARSIALAALVSNLVVSAPDVVFLKHVLNGDSDATLLRGEALSLDVSQRLLDLGLPEQSLDIAQAGPDGRSRRARKIAAAALLELELPEDAEIELIGLNGEDVTRLRAQARLQMGDYEYARVHLEALGADDTALDAAWIAGDLESVANADRGALSDISRLALNEPIQPEVGNPTLSAATRLVETSQDTRATLEALLEETRVSKN